MCSRYPFIITGNKCKFDAFQTISNGITTYFINADTFWYYHRVIPLPHTELNTPSELPALQNLTRLDWNVIRIGRGIFDDLGIENWNFADSWCNAIRTIQLKEIAYVTGMNRSFYMPNFKPP